jgi:hypothetical protein
MRSALRPPDIGAIIAPKRDNAAVVLHALRRLANEGRRIIRAAASLVGGYPVHHAIREVRCHHLIGYFAALHPSSQRAEPDSIA